MTSDVRSVAALICVAAVATFWAGCGGAPAAHVVERSRLAMGSQLTLTAWAADERAAPAGFDEVFGEFDRLDRMMSVWKADSEIVRLNAAAGDHPVPVSPEMIEV